MISHEESVVAGIGDPGCDVRNCCDVSHKIVTVLLLLAGRASPSPSLESFWDPGTMAATTFQRGACFNAFTWRSLSVVSKKRKKSLPFVRASNKPGEPITRKKKSVDAFLAF